MIEVLRFSTKLEWFYLLVLLGGLHHDKVPLVVQPFMKVVVMCLFVTQSQSQHGAAHS